MRRTVAYIAGAILFAPLPCIKAQDGPPPLGIGERVRVTHHCPAPGAPLSVPWCKTHTGTVDVITADSLVLTMAAQGTRLTVPVASVKHIRAQRRLNRASMVGRGAAYGGGVLGTLALFFGIPAMGECKGGMSFSPCGASLGEVFVATAVFGGVGGGIGALIGSVVPRRRRWVRIEPNRLRMSFAPRRDGVSLGMSVSF